MSAQPTDEECADMFRVMMFEMMEMHPAWQKLKYRVEGFKRYMDTEKKPKKEMIRYHMNQIWLIFEERK